MRLINFAVERAFSPRRQLIISTATVEPRRVQSDSDNCL